MTDEYRTNASLMNTEQTYCWNTEVAQQDAKYYPNPQVLNFPDYSQPPNYNSSYSYNVPPPNVTNIPPLNVSSVPPPNIPPDVNPPGNSMYNFAPTTYNEATSFSTNVPYQNQMDSQCDQYYGRMDPVHKQYTSENYANWNVKSDNVYNNAGNEWYSNNSSTSWPTYQNTSATWYDASTTTYDKEKSLPTQVYETPQRMEEFKWKHDNREMSKYPSSRQRSRSPYKQEKMYRSQYEDPRDRYRQYNREVSNSRDSTYNKHFERSSSKKHGSSSRSEESYISNRSKKRSKSREPHSSRDTTPTNNSSKRTKGPTEREILLEKYR